MELSRREARLPDESTQPLPVFHLKKILVPVDFSSSARKALHYGEALARQFGASLVLLNVVPPYMPVPDLVTIDLVEVEQQFRDSARKELGEWQRTVAKEVATEVVLKTGDAGQEIVWTAKELEADLIVLSTHGRTGLAHVLMGSTAERVVQHAGCPVLIVREKEHEFVTE